MNTNCQFLCASASLLIAIQNCVICTRFVACSFKAAQIPHMAAQSKSGSTISLYRLSDHVDIARGPLIASTKLLGRFSITAVSGIVTDHVLVAKTSFNYDLD